MKCFLGRRDTGRQLALKLLKYADQPNVIVLALPRGGVPVAYEVAQAIHAPMDVMIVRKLGLPGQEELAIGAVASGEIQILNEELIDILAVSQEVVNRVTDQEKVELKRREQRYRGDRPPLEVHARTLILIDDGLATRASMLAAVRGLHDQQPTRIVVAIPAAPIQAIDLLQSEAEEIVCVISPELFDGVGRWYENFTQITDEEVQSLLDERV